MSQHAIEDLIETTIQLVDRSTLDEVRINALIHALLQLQARYDTSLTWFRMHEILLHRAVLQRTPVKALTDPALQAQAMAADAPGWLDHDDDATYIELENNTRVLYRQETPAEHVALPAVFQTVLELANAAEDTALFADWYGLLVNGWLDETFGESDGILTTLDGLLASPALLEIRTIAAHAGLKRRRGAPEDLALPKLADAIEPGEVEREFGLRFFLEPKRTPSALRKAYAKAFAQQLRINTLATTLVEKRIGKALEAIGWRAAPSDVPLQWCWVRDIEGSRQFIWFTHELQLGILMIQLGLQHAQLLAWQQRPANEALHAIHFEHVAATFFTEEVRDSKDVGAFGGWVLDASKPDAQLEASIDRLVQVIPTLDQHYFGFIGEHFPQPLLAREIDGLLHLLEEGDENGVIPEDLLFDSPDSLLLAFTFHHLSRGEETKAAAMVERVRARLAQRTRLNPWLRDQVVPFLQHWDQGRRNMPMPAVLHSQLVKHLHASGAS